MRSNFSKPSGTAPDGDFDSASTDGRPIERAMQEDHGTLTDNAQREGRAPRCAGTSDDPGSRCLYFAQTLLVDGQVNSTHTLRLEEGRGWTTHRIRNASPARRIEHGLDLKTAARAFARSICGDPLWERERVEIYWACMDVRECACDVYEKASWWPLQVRLMLEDGLIGRYSMRNRVRPPVPSLAAAAGLSEERARSDILEGLWEVMCLTEDREVERSPLPPYVVSDIGTPVKAVI